MQRQDRQALLDNAGSFRAACTFSLRHRLWQTHFFIVLESFLSYPVFGIYLT